ILGVVYTTEATWDDEHHHAGNPTYCNEAVHWIGATVKSGVSASIILENGPAIRVMVDNGDVVAVVLVPGHTIVKSLLRMMRRVIGEAKGVRAAEVERRLAEARAQEE